MTLDTDLARLDAALHVLHDRLVVLDQKTSILVEYIYVHIQRAHLLPRRPLELSNPLIAPDQNGHTGHTKLRNTVLIQDVHAAQRDVGRALTTLFHRLARSAACTAAKHTPRIALFVAPNNVRALLDLLPFGTHRGRTAVSTQGWPLHSGKFHKACSLLTTITGLEQGPTWSISVDDTQSATVQATTIDGALAWATLTHWPSLLTAQGRLLRITQHHDHAPALALLHAHPTPPCPWDASTATTNPQW